MFEAALVLFKLSMLCLLVVICVEVFAMISLKCEFGVSFYELIFEGWDIGAVKMYTQLLEKKYGRPTKFLHIYYVVRFFGVLGAVVSIIIMFFK